MRLGSLVLVINKEESSSQQYLMASTNNYSSSNNHGGGGGGDVQTACDIDDFKAIDDGVVGTGEDLAYAPDYEDDPYMAGLRYGTKSGSRSDDPVSHLTDTSPTDKQQLTIVDKRDRWHNTSGAGGKRQHQRLVYKNGECNVTRANIKKRRQRYMADIFTTLVDIKWRWNLLNFVLAFILSWMIFALAWWLICFSHGDFDSNKEDRKPCVEEVYDFTTALLFSIETQQTIGFGSRRTNPHCPEAILVMMCQSCFGVIIQALMTGLVFAKLSRPKKRAETLLFSKNALVCKRDGQLCLLFRVGDMRKSHIVEAHVRAIMIKRRVTQEGEVIPLYQYDLQLGDGETEGRLFMVWPVIVEHRITEDSPLWELSAEDLHREQFELVVVLEGIVESTGMTTQARTSYLPSEILWGHRFEKLVTFQKESGQYLIDYSRFHSTAPIEMPQCSAKDMEEMVRSGSSGSSDDDEDTISVRSDPVVQSSTRNHHPQAAHEFNLEDVQNRRLSIPTMMRKNGINSVALAAFDLQNEEQNMKGLINCDGSVAEDTYQFM